MRIELFVSDGIAFFALLGGCGKADDGGLGSGEETAEQTAGEVTGTASTTTTATTGMMSSTGSDSDTSDPSGPDSGDAEATDSDPTAADETGGLPDGVLAQGETFPGDIVRVGDDLFWPNHSGGDCIRRVGRGGGVAVDVACEPDDSTMPIQVIEYDGILAYAYMSTSQGLDMGFGGVRLVDPAGGAPETIDDGSRFKSSSSNPFCNDALSASGPQLFWYAHELSQYSSSIVHYDGANVDAFAADSPFPYGVTATPTAIYWSATEAFNRLDLSGLGAAPTTIGMTQGSTCGRTSAGETLYLSSRGTFTESPALFRYADGLFSNVGALDEVVYDLAVDATHLYLAYDSRVDRLPLATLEGGAFETIVEGSVVGGILVDGGQLVWTDYEGGEVRVQPLP